MSNYVILKIIAPKDKSVTLSHIGFFPAFALYKPIRFLTVKHEKSLQGEMLMYSDLRFPDLSQARASVAGLELTTEGSLKIIRQAGVSLKTSLNNGTLKILAHLVGQLANIQKVRGSIPSPGQVRLSLLLYVHPALNGKLGLLRPGESKGGEESNGKLPQMPYAKNNQDPTSSSPMLGLSVGPTLLYAKFWQKWKNMS
ncbi:hypothetical protein PoB_002402600 [Plakobranchus ocellatus]|uniref:Uncharacterized protein n=1 Tax=Plakobranchus ocellatus TaxID=259542 RepID=A0AAV3ZE47_9GAST|nr:hypothetical protein PoB_002402600 [Plakobranchus ocellatus]